MDVLILWFAALLAPPAHAGGGVALTRHNLSVTGPGPVRSVDEDEICIFCHAAHTESDLGSLWNRRTSPAPSYRAYESPTLQAPIGQPDGSSRLCLSCHDGTLALGATASRAEPVRMLGADASGRLRGESNLGLDLSGDHPISVEYAQARGRGRVRNRTQLHAHPVGADGNTLLDGQGKVQCVSCHDPHSDPAAAGARVPPFWRGTSFTEVCEACHVAPQAISAHGDGAALPEGCGSCHVGHGVPGQPLLDKAEEQACFTCHGSPAAQREAVAAGRLGPGAVPVRVDDLFRMPYRHPVDASTGAHRPDEDRGAEATGAQRHVECLDCHDLHGQERPASSRDRQASRTAQWTRSEEICYRCHGGTSTLPFGQTDKSREFGPSARSSHPIDPSAAPSGGSRSLIGARFGGEGMTCGSCHGADWDDDRMGVHGSRNPSILRAAYEIADGAEESASTYALCYNCHSRQVVLGDKTFAGHAEHVVTHRTSCYTCHDSHGSEAHTRLIRFGKDPRIDPVRPSSTGLVAYDEATGACTLMCHGSDHLQWAYP